MITTIVRSERFCDGAIEGAWQDGTCPAALAPLRSHSSAPSTRPLEQVSGSDRLAPMARVWLIRAGEGAVELDAMRHAGVIAVSRPAPDISSPPPEPVRTCADGSRAERSERRHGRRTHGAGPQCRRPDRDARLGGRVQACSACTGGWVRLPQRTDTCPATSEVPTFGARGRAPLHTGGSEVGGRTRASVRSAWVLRFGRVSVLFHPAARPQRRWCTGTVRCAIRTPSAAPSLKAPGHA